MRFLQVHQFIRISKDISRKSIIAGTLTSLGVEEEERLVSQGAKRGVSSFSRAEKTSRDDPKRIYTEREECLEVFLERREEQ